MSKAYSSNLTEWQWKLIEPLIPLAKPGGRSNEIEIWLGLNAIFYSGSQVYEGHFRFQIPFWAGDPSSSE
jgi:hypothetical protein